MYIGTVINIVSGLTHIQILGTEMLNNVLKYYTIDITVPNKPHYYIGLKLKITKDLKLVD